jgi:thiamine pyrophosphate-dependent acetolactate synthase large subunit-like protein
VIATRYGPDPVDVRRAATMLVEARRPVIYAGQGVHYARAWPQLRRFAELLGAPVMTSLGGKSAFPEIHPLALGSGGVAVPRTVHHFLKESDLIFGIGVSLTQTSFGVTLPPNKTVIHATLDPDHLNHDAGSPRDQLSPFWTCTEPLTYLGWGKMTQLGYGLGLAMGAKLACADKLCINLWGDAAIGFTGIPIDIA